MKHAACFLLLLAVLAMALPAPASTAPETQAQREARMKWWTDARFGMFIHWGLYALPARHEWVKNHEKHHRRGLPEVLRALQPRPLQSPGVGAPGQGRPG